VNFVIDTGCTDLIISGNEAIKLGADLRELEFAGWIGGIGGKSKSYRMPRVAVVFMCENNTQWSAELEEVVVADKPPPERKTKTRGRLMKEEWEVKILTPTLLGREFMARHGFILHWDFEKRNAYLSVP